MKEVNHVLLVVPRVGGSKDRRKIMQEDRQNGASPTPSLLDAFHQTPLPTSASSGPQKAARVAHGPSPCRRRKVQGANHISRKRTSQVRPLRKGTCLLYTSDAADE